MPTKNSEQRSSLKFSHRENLLSMLHDMRESVFETLHVFREIPSPEQMRAKTPDEYVTENDIKVQNIVTRFLSERYPDIPFVSEEMPESHAVSLLESGQVFVLDPIDGTHNFMNGLPSCAVSIAYVENGRPLVGCVYAPLLEETFTAISGMGARLNGRKLQPIHRPFESSVIQVEGHWKADHPEISKTVLGTRVIGSCALAMCYVAAGRGSAYIAVPECKAWDMAAASLIAKEAGLEIIDLDGSPYQLKLMGQPIVCFDEDRDAVLEMIRRSEAAYLTKCGTGKPPVL